MIIDNVENKIKITNDLINIAQFEGWSNETLKKSFDNSAIPIEYLSIIFENKIFSAIDFITKSRCEALSSNVKNFSEFENLRHNQKIKYLIISFLEFDTKNKISLKRLVNFYLSPQNILEKECGFKALSHGAAQLFMVADCMWLLSKDHSTDFNFYSKRLLLSKIILRSLMVYCDDNSADSIITKNFIESQIIAVSKFSSFKKDIKEKIFEFKNNFENNIFDNKNIVKNPKDILLSLPFLRQINKNFFKKYE